MAKLFFKKVCKRQKLDLQRRMRKLIPYFASRDTFSMIEEAEKNTIRRLHTHTESHIVRFRMTGIGVIGPHWNFMNDTND